MAIAVILLCIPVQFARAGDVLEVYAVNYPLKYFAERIGGPRVAVTLPLPPDVDPAYWEPGIAEIAAFQQADLILLNGAGYARWTGKVSLPRAKTVDTSRAIKDRYITTKEVTTHSHGAEGKHAHEALAFTTWLDPSLAARQAGAVYEALVRRRPELASEFQANLASLENDLLALDTRLKDIVSKNPATPVVFSHPVYDYLIRRYGMNARSVHWEPDEVPTGEQLKALKQVLAIHPAGWMIWEGTPDGASVEKLTALGIQDTVFDPCGNQPASGDFMTVMQQNVLNIEAVFR